MSSAPAPVTAEATTLAAIDTEIARISSYIQTFPLGATAEAFETWLDAFGDFAWQLNQFTPVTDWLAHQGLPAAKQKLLSTTLDLAGARQKYIEVYQSAAARESTARAIWADANEFATEQIERGSRYRQAVENAWLQRSFDINEDSCYGCHKYIGIPGGGYCVDCARHRGVIGAFER